MMFELSKIKNWVLILLCIFSIPQLQAQGDFAMIRKNINVLAKDLNHDLNKTKDTLILTSKKKIFRVYTVGGYSGLIDHKINTKKFKVPLRRLRTGKYVFVVDQLNLKIVFQVHILRNYFDIGPVFEDTEAIVIAPKELTKKEKVNRIVKDEIGSREVETVAIELEEKAIEDRLFAVKPKPEPVIERPEVIAEELIEDKPKLDVNVEEQVVDEKMPKVEEELTSEEIPTTVVNRSNDVLINSDVQDKESALKRKLEQERISVARILRAKSSDELNSKTKKITEVKTPKKLVTKPTNNPLDPKSYNLTDLEREHIQTREEARKELALARKLKAADDSIKKNN